jgi:hypothetical protein
VDGLLAVPIDIQRVTAELVFDRATLSGTGDATVEFTMGAQAGRPIFDLRQTIASAWLGGAPLAVAALAHHDFGGGLQAQRRVIDAPVGKTLRLDLVQRDTRSRRLLGGIAVEIRGI